MILLLVMFSILFFILHSLTINGVRFAISVVAVAVLFAVMLLLLVAY